MSKHLLVVDDDPLYMDLVEDVALQHKYSVSKAPHGVAALDILSSKPIDLIISDVEMAVMDGLTFHTRLRSDHRFDAIPFVFLTGATAPHVAEYIARHSDIRLIEKAHLVRKLSVFFHEMDQGS